MDKTQAMNKADRNFIYATQDSRRILGGEIFTFSWCFDDVIKAFTIQDDSEKIF